MASSLTSSDLRNAADFGSPPSSISTMSSTAFLMAIFSLYL